MTRLAVLLVFVSNVAALAQPPERQRGPQRFDQAFELEGIEFDAAQQEQVEKLREKYVDKLVDLQRRRGGIETPEIRRARREAQEAATKAGKTGRELREAVEQAVPLSDEQQAKLAELQREQRQLVTAIQGELRALLTDEQREQLARRQPPQNRPEGGAPRPTHPNVSYGPHRRNVMDVWLAKSETPTPVLFSIHGGGFRGGNKSVAAELLNPCLEAGISVVAITYRLSDEAIAPAQFHDCARAVQFVRSKAKEWNLEGTRIASTGGSAGAGLSLWLAFHDDLADPNAEDPVLRESTRLSCVSVYNGQTSYDPRFIRELFPGTDTYRHPALSQLYDIDFDMLDELPEAKYRLFEETASLTHLSKDDVPAMLCYGSEDDTPIRNQGVGIHHPKFARVLEERMKPLGLECRVHTGVGREEYARLTMEFVRRHLGVARD